MISLSEWFRKELSVVIHSGSGGVNGIVDCGVSTKKVPLADMKSYSFII